MGCHCVLEGEEKGFYDFSNEPSHVWMQDKDVKFTTNRWKIIVAFKNGHVKELMYSITDEGDTKLELADYLRFPPGVGFFANQPRPLPGKI